MGVSVNEGDIGQRKTCLKPSYSRYELVQVDFSQATGKDRIAYTFETEVTQNTAKLVTILSKR